MLIRNGGDIPGVYVRDAFTPRAVRLHADDGRECVEKRTNNVLGTLNTDRPARDYVSIRADLAEVVDQCGFKTCLHSFQ